MGHQHRHRRVAVGGKRRAAVEAKPAHPEHAGTGNGHCHVVRRQRPLGKSSSPTEHEGRNQRAYSCRDVYNGATRKVHKAQIAEPATAPDPMANGNVDSEQPQRREQHDGRKTHSLGEAAHHKCGRDDREGHLKQSKRAGR